MIIIINMLYKKIKIAAVFAAVMILSSVFVSQYAYADESENTEETQLSESETTEEAQSDDVEILLTFGGDVTFGLKNEEDYKGTQPYFLEENGMDYSLIFSNLYDIFSNDDLTFVNLETTITDATSHMDKTYYFRAPYEYVNILLEGSVEAVSIANNHAKDYYTQGREDTVRTLMENDILVAGENYAISTEIKGIKVGILAYVTFQTSFDYETALERDIEYMKKTHDIVIVSMHWGQELDYEANSSDVELAHKMVDLGADLIIGHHPHVIQGIEYYNGSYIVYSLGNCSFAGSSNPTNDDILIFQQKFVLTEDGVEAAEARVIPCSVSSPDYVSGYGNDYIPTPYEGDEITRVLNRVLEFSEHLSYGLLELTEDWIYDPYTIYEYKQEKASQSD